MESQLTSLGDGATITSTVVSLPGLIHIVCYTLGPLLIIYSAIALYKRKDSQKKKNKLLLFSILVIGVCLSLFPIFIEKMVYPTPEAQETAKLIESSGEAKKL